MRKRGYLGGLAAMALLAMALPAHARCADDLDALQTRIARLEKQHPPPPQAFAAAKILKKLAESQSSDEVDCYNAVARAKRVLRETPPEPPKQAER